MKATGKQCNEAHKRAQPLEMSLVVVGGFSWSCPQRKVRCCFGKFVSLTILPCLIWTD